MERFIRRRTYITSMKRVIGSPIAMNRIKIDTSWIRPPCTNHYSVFQFTKIGTRAELMKRAAVSFVATLKL